MARIKDLKGQTEMMDFLAGNLADRFASRESMPTETTSRDDELAFVVWAHDPLFIEDTKPVKVSAAFRYLQEAIDYIAYCQDRGHTVMLQSPCDMQTYRPTDRRAVAK